MLEEEPALGRWLRFLPLPISRGSCGRWKTKSRHLQPHVSPESLSCLTFRPCTRLPSVLCSYASPDFQLEAEQSRTSTALGSLFRNQRNVSITLKPSTLGNVVGPGVTLVELGMQLLHITWRKTHLRRHNGDKGHWQPMAQQAFPDAPSFTSMKGWQLSVWPGARASCWLLVVSQMKKSEWTSVRKSVPPITKVQAPWGLPRLKSGSSADFLLFCPLSLLALIHY